MSARTGISWTNATWNPATGCDRVSEGCDHCYALTLAARLKAMGNPRYQRDGTSPGSGPGFGLTLHWDKIDEPLHWRRPRRVFVNSMSDLFHPEIPPAFIAMVWAVMVRTPQHTYQILTKRPARMRALLASESLRTQVADLVRPLVLRWPVENVWLGVSVENQRWAKIRIPKLLRSPAAVHFLSCEPLLGPLDLRPWLKSSPDGALAPEVAAVPGIDWVIAGGESGPGWRPMDLRWPRQIRDQCLSAGVAFFYKQGSGPRPEMDRELDGEMWEQIPNREGALAARGQVPEPADREALSV